MSNEWDSAAGLRRSQIEQGKDLTFTKVFLPLYSALFDELRPQSVLEVGMGTGHLALELSQGRTMRYVGIEPSAGMFHEAVEVLRGSSVEVIPNSLEEFPSSERFQLLLSHMCLHVVSEIDDFCSSVEAALDVNGAYLMAIPHPAFFNSYKRVIPEENYSYMTIRAAKISFAITSDPTGIIKDVPYFHRPLSNYVRALARAGLGMSFMREVLPNDSVQALYGAPWLTPRYLLMGGSRHSEVLTKSGKEIAERLLNCEIVSCDQM